MMKNGICLFMILIALAGCNLTESNTPESNEYNRMKTELDSLKSSIQSASLHASKQLITFLTFQNKDAEEAMNFYVGLFENSKVNKVQRYGENGPAEPGTILFAEFELNGSAFACSDSYIKHEWDFTPGVSIMVDCNNVEELEHLFNQLSDGGKVLMPIDNYGFSTKFAFVEDRFGVSWQLNLN